MTYNLQVILLCLLIFRTAKHRGVRGAVWFGFEHKSHSNREIKKHAIWFGSVDF